MAVNVVNYGTNTSDPNASTALAGGVKTTPVDKGGIAQHGQQASGSALDDAGMLDRSKVVFDKVIEYHAGRYPFYTDMLKSARQVSIPGKKEAVYPEVGDIQDYAYTYQATAQGAGGAAVALSLYANDAPIFQPKTLIFVEQPGYDENGQQDGSLLVLYVTEFDANGMPKVVAINGPLATAGDPSSVRVPAIPAGTKIMAGAPALNEVEIEMSPDNIIPTMATAYLQKKGYAIDITEFFRQSDKDANWGENDIRRFSLDNYKRKYTKTTLFSAPRKFYTKDSKGFNRLNYTQKGVIQQLRMAYQLSGVVTYNDLIAIAKMLFTKWTNATTITVYCEADFIEQLLNIDFGKKTPIVHANDDVLKANVAKFECTFGTLRFVYEQSLTDLGLTGAAIALPVEDCIHLYRQNGITYKVDRRKGEGGVAEESQADYFIQEDTIIVPTMCSMLIGTADVFNHGYAPIESLIVSVTELPASPTSGDVVYLTQPFTDTTGDDDVFYPIGAYEYNGTAWKPYTRHINA